MYLYFKEAEAHMIQMLEYENDMNEVLGNNNRTNSTNSSITSEKIHAEKFSAFNYHDHTTTETTSSSIDDQESEFVWTDKRKSKLKKKKQKASRAFFLSQAAISGSETLAKL